MELTYEYYSEIERKMYPTRIRFGVGVGEITTDINHNMAIGLVLTAKSIARYDKIASDKDFAEYYLLGTLMSTVIVIVCSVII